MARKPTKAEITRNIIYDILTMLFGAGIFAISINMFIVPGAIITGGATGLATLLHLLFNIPVGLMIAAINLPLLVFYAIKYGIRGVLKTLICVACTSVATDILTFLPSGSEDPLLCAVFGGAGIGLACGLLFSRGFTNGGSDLAAWLLRKKFKNISTGRFILIIDLAVILLSSLVTKNFIGIFYSVLCVFINTKIVDSVLNSSGSAKLVFVMSKDYDEIAETIASSMIRGVTMLNAKGWYSKSEYPVLMCAVKPSELYQLKMLISRIDPHAFIICAKATEVLGEGFGERE